MYWSRQNDSGNIKANRGTKLIEVFRKEKDGGFAWYEHGFSENIPIPFIDLAGYEIGFGKQFEKAVLSLYFGRNYFSLGRLAYSIFLIKNNLREYTVVFPCSHSVFDAMSDEVIQRSLHTYYEKIKRNEPITSESGYDEYILQIKKGPQQISEAELIALFELEDYKRSLLALKRVYGRIKAWIAWSLASTQKRLTSIGHGNSHFLYL